MLTALSVVREKELGSIVNLYVTPATRLEFLLGKQAPYIAIGMFNCLLMCFVAVFLFGVPFKGSFAGFVLGGFIYVCATTAMGLFISTFMSSQIAAVFATALLTLIPSIQFSGMIDPVSSLQGGGRIIGEIYPSTYFMNIAAGPSRRGSTFMPCPAPSGRSCSRSRSSWRSASAFSRNRRGDLCGSRTFTISASRKSAVSSGIPC